MPIRITSPRASRTVMTTSSPIITLSPARLVSTSTRRPFPSVDRTRLRPAGPGPASLAPGQDGPDRQVGAGEYDLDRHPVDLVDDDGRHQVGRGGVPAGGDD